MVATCSAEHEESSGVKQEASDEESDEEDGEDAEEELEELFEEDAAAVDFFAFEEEFHGGEANAAVAQSAEDMDEYGQGDERSARQEVGRIEEKLREEAHGEESAG